MLNDILLLSPGKLVCIQDSLVQDGHNLLKAFSQHAINNKDKEVHIFCYENSIAKFKMGLMNYNEKHVHFHDCWTDHRGWLCDMNREAEFPIQNDGTCSILSKLPDTSTNKNIVIIDSLSSLILHIGFTKCYKELHSLWRASNLSQCVCLIHEDAVPDAENSLLQLEHLAISNIRIEPPNQNSNGCPIASITHRKPGGKIINEVEFYSIDSEWQISSQKLQSTQSSVRRNVDANADSSIPIDLTTFRISLGDQEKQARSELVLPYVKVHKEKGGKVFYQPDAADDWDEEDPDDDLDI